MNQAHHQGEREEGGGWVVLAEQRANEIDFPENEDGYMPDPASAASYDGVNLPRP